MFQPGDIVRFHSPTAGKQKYHLCVCTASSDERCYFLFLNSKPGYPGEIVYDDGFIDGLPVSPTGKTVVSFGMLIQVDWEKLRLFQAEKVSEASKEIRDDIIGFCSKTPVLSGRDKRIILRGLEGQN